MSSALDRFERSLVAASDRLVEASTSNEPQRNRQRLGRGPRRSSRRGLLLALLGSALVAGGAATAATLLDSGQRLADGTVRCYAGTTPHSNLTRPYSNLPGGDSANWQTPTAICRRSYRLNAHTGIDPLGFVACRYNPTTVAVYVADGRSSQCGRLGEKALPASFPRDLARLRTLEQDLTQLQGRQDCPSATALAAQVRGTLASLGFDDWRIVLPAKHATPEQLNSPAGTGAGPCGSLIGMPADNSPNSAVSVQPNLRAVYIQAALPRHTNLFVYHAQGRLYARSYNYCFTSETIRQLVDRAFYGSGLRTRFATTASPDGLGFVAASQKLYDRGCVRFNSAYSADNGRYIDIWLVARHAPQLPAKRLFPRPTAFTS